jgi:hypothetical protein
MTAGGIAATNIAKWDGNNWSALGSGIHDYSLQDWPPTVRVLAVLGGDLYAAGNFRTAGGNESIGIAKWDGSSWSALGSGMNDGVDALVVSGGNLYAGGFFTTAGGKISGYVARAVLGEVDEDNDGIPDSLDQCPGTPPGAIVNAEGCSLDQLVPCEGPWRNHGQYVSTIARISESFREQGLITERQRDDIISAAARSDCGDKRNPLR